MPRKFLISMCVIFTALPLQCLFLAARAPATPGKPTAASRLRVISRSSRLSGTGLFIVLTFSPEVVWQVSALLSTANCSALYSSSGWPSCPMAYGIATPLSPIAGRDAESLIHFVRARPRLSGRGRDKRREPPRITAWELRERVATPQASPRATYRSSSARGPRSFADRSLSSSGDWSQLMSCISSALH